MAHTSQDAGGGPPVRGQSPAFRQSPFWPATVLVLILAAAAGLFAGSYTYSMANPTPRLIPTAVVGSYEKAGGQAFLRGLEQALDASVRVHPCETRAAARSAIEQQEVFAVFELRDDGPYAALDVSGAYGASVAELLAQTAPAVGKKLGVQVTVRDVNPLQQGDPRGLAIFYISWPP
ncbi:ABC transporter permease OS=Streptomyces tendae OX=1932 GN=GUR47_28690 PE=4 SV=1 [Streptomyces tendae]